MNITRYFVSWLTKRNGFVPLTCLYVTWGQKALGTSPALSLHTRSRGSGAELGPGNFLRGLLS